MPRVCIFSFNSLGFTELHTALAFDLSRKVYVQMQRELSNVMKKFDVPNCTFAFVCGNYLSACCNYLQLGKNAWKMATLKQQKQAVFGDILYNFQNVFLTGHICLCCHYKKVYSKALFAKLYSTVIILPVVVSKIVSVKLY